MRLTLRRRVTTVTLAGAAAAAVAASLIVAPAAQAYPPGTDMVLQVSQTAARKGSIVVATARNVQPGCVVTFAYSSGGQFGEDDTANAQGVASTSARVTRAGVLSLTASTSADCGGSAEAAGRNITVYTKPGRVQGLTAVCLLRGDVICLPRKGAAALKWRAASKARAGYARVSGYNVAIYTSATGGDAILLRTTTSTGTTLAGLAKGTYWATVTITNSKGLTGPAAKRVKFRVL